MASSRSEVVELIHKQLSAFTLKESALLDRVDVVLLAPGEVILVLVKVSGQQGFPFGISDADRTLSQLHALEREVRLLLGREVYQLAVFTNRTVSDQIGRLLEGRRIALYRFRKDPGPAVMQLRETLENRLRARGPSAAKVMSEAATWTTQQIQHVLSSLTPDDALEAVVQVAGGAKPRDKAAMITTVQRILRENGLVDSPTTIHQLADSVRIWLQGVEADRTRRRVLVERLRTATELQRRVAFLCAVADSAETSIGTHLLDLLRMQDERLTLIIRQCEDLFGDDHIQVGDRVTALEVELQGIRGNTDEIARVLAEGKGSTATSGGTG